MGGDGPGETHAVRRDDRRDAHPGQSDHRPRDRIRRYVRDAVALRDVPGRQGLAAPMTLAFTVYGVAKPKGNMRAFHPKGMKFPIVTESNRNVKSWQQLVAAGASHALHQVPLEQQAVL